MEEIGLECVPAVNLFALPMGFRKPPPACVLDRLLRLDIWLAGLECDLFEVFSDVFLSLPALELFTSFLFSKESVCSALGAGCTEIWAAITVWINGG